MDLSERVRRRHRADAGVEFVSELGALAPTVHPQEPVHRGAVIERFLDAIDPVFDGELPPPVYLQGPSGSGKSALLTALVHSLRREVTGRGVIQTSTRGDQGGDFEFTYVDTRRANTPCRLYHSALQALTNESVPRVGISTDELRSRLDGLLVQRNQSLLFVVDHVDDPGTLPLDVVRRALDQIDARTTWVAAGRSSLGEIGSEGARTIELRRYSEHSLADILDTRASRAFRSGFEHEWSRKISEWAEGNVHNALAALFIATIQARRTNASRIRSQDIEAGVDAVPDDGIHIGRVLTLPENRRSVLVQFLDLPSENEPIGVLANRISQQVDLTEGTVQRVLYEMAETEILRRVELRGNGASGRRPSRLEPRFPVPLFRHLNEEEDPTNGAGTSLRLIENSS